MATPRKCIFEQDDKKVILLNRTMLKGGHTEHTYTFDGDFNTVKYQIPDDVYNYFDFYIKKTDGFKDNKNNTLILNSYHFKSPIDMELPRYEHLYNMFNKFYKNIVVGKYGYRLVDSNDYNGFLNNKDIGIVKIGDIRHIAMISLIVSGNSPTICKELAGHTTVNQSLHYFSNISNLVECKSYEFYCKSKSKKLTEINMRGKSFYDYELKIKVENGWCTSKKMKNLDTSDCVCTMNENGEIGECDCCIYFINDTNRNYFDTDKSKIMFEKDLEELKIAFTNVVGDESQTEIKSALLRLQNSSFLYSIKKINDWKKHDEELQ